MINTDTDYVILLADKSLADERFKAADFSDPRDLIRRFAGLLPIDLTEEGDRTGVTIGGQFHKLRKDATFYKKALALIWPLTDDLPIIAIDWASLHAAFWETEGCRDALQSLATAWEEAGMKPRAFPMRTLLEERYGPTFRLVDDADRKPDRKPASKKVAAPKAKAKAKRAGWTEERRAKHAATIDEKRLDRGFTEAQVEQARATGRKPRNQDNDFNARLREIVLANMTKYLTECPARDRPAMKRFMEVQRARGGYDFSSITKIMEEQESIIERLERLEKAA